MTEHNVQRVAIAGFGAIGKVVAEHLDRGIDGLSLAAVSARDTKRAEAAMAGFAHAAPVLPLTHAGGNIRCPIAVRIDSSCRVDSPAACELPLAGLCAGAGQLFLAPPAPGDHV